MTYALVLMYCIAVDGNCHRVEDAWFPLGYATLERCEKRRRELTAVVVMRDRPARLVSRCEMIGQPA